MVEGTTGLSIYGFQIISSGGDDNDVVRGSAYHGKADQMVKYMFEMRELRWLVNTLLLQMVFFTVESLFVTSAANLYNVRAHKHGQC